MIQKHRYPRDYFFAITNHGLNQIASEEGLGFSLIRPRKSHPPPASAPASCGSPPEDSVAGAQSRAQVTEAPADMAMDDLAAQIGGMASSLDFVPRGLRKKAGKALVV